jgi:hypothetical protein
MNPNGSAGRLDATPAKPRLSGAETPVKKRRQMWRAERAQPASRDAQRRAAIVLEVLAGVRFPHEAASALGMGPARYYLLEQHALRGLLAACEVQPPGQKRSHQKQIALLEREIVRLKQDCARHRALVRASQRTIGLAAPPQEKPTAKASGKPPGKRPRKRRPVVRALKAAVALRAAAASHGEPDSSGASAAEVLQQTVVSSPLLSLASALPATAAGAE